MSQGRLNALLAAALAAIWGLTWATREDPGRRSHTFMPEMARSLTHEAQAEAAWAGGLPPGPPEGSIPRGHPPLPYRAGKEDAERAGRELKNPFAADEPSLARGAKVFGNYCAVCHGAGGAGDGTVTKAGVPAPPSLFGDSARRMGDGRIFHVITYGQGNMPAHAAQIFREDRWKAVLHVRRLQHEAAKAARPAAPEQPKPSRAKADPAPATGAVARR